MTSANGLLINGDFEMGDLDPWKVIIPWGISEMPPFERPAGEVKLVNEFVFSYSNVLTTREPVHGTRFVEVATESEGYFTGNKTYDIALSQTLFLSRGDQLSGWSFFYNGDYAAQDQGWVMVYVGINDSDGVPVAIPWIEYSGGMSPGGNGNLN